ncbi:putative internalin [Enhygromyxa salina]|uniref:Putative internalin n=1 Tax=Enhygromyxa salina TaxID=215803 RepID=A0A0C1ZXF9_9BACT|nr:MYXO-CTERM sorting domain-containing protein [Enhygromyxa salina]KIG15788.1 putative internalin [Enhygromyxa salina]
MAWRSFISGTAMLCVVCLCPSLVDAAGPEEASEFSPFYEEMLLGFEDAAVDTGWIPANSPVQLRLFADAANTVMIDLPGTAYYDWETEELRFEGDPMAGFFEYDVGLEIVASVKVDVSLAQWESDLLGPYDWGIEASEMFTPYLLEGSPDRPVTLTEKSGAFDLVSIPLVPDIIILSGNLDIALFVDIEASLQCNRIEVLGADGEITSFTLEGQSQWVDPGAGPDDVVLPATAFCQLQTKPTLIMYPHLVVEVLFDEYDIAGIEIPIDLPVIDEEIALETMDLSYPYWEEPEDEPGDGDGDPAGDEGGDSGEDGGFDETGGETGTGGDPGASLGDEGCNCSAEDEPGRGLGWSALGLLALAGLRRRR